MSSLSWESLPLRVESLARQPGDAQEALGRGFLLELCQSRASLLLPDLKLHFTERELGLEGDDAPETLFGIGEGLSELRDGLSAASQLRFCPSTEHIPPCSLLGNLEGGLFECQQRPSRVAHCQSTLALADRHKWISARQIVFRRRGIIESSKALFVLL